MGDACGARGTPASRTGSSRTGSCRPAPALSKGHVRAPIGIWEEDWSAARAAAGELRASGVRDVRAFLAARHDTLHDLARRVPVRDFNVLSARQHARPDRTRADTIHDEIGLQAFLGAFAALAEGERLVVTQELEQVVDGQRIHVRDTVFFPEDDRDDWKRVVHTTEDITDQYRAERALRESEERLRHLLESINAIPWEADVETWRHTYVGPQAVSILGLPQEAWYRPDFWLEQVHPEDRALALAFTGIHASDERHHEFEYRVRDVNGETVWVHDIVSTARSESGRELLRGVMIDITDRKRVELELERQRVLFEAIFKSVPDGLVVESTDREIILCNSGYARIFGYSESELVGMIPRKLFADPEEFDRQGKLRFNPDAEPLIRPYVTEYRRASGERFPAEVVGSLLKDPENRTLGYFALVRDITERHRAEEALEFRRAFQEIMVDISKRFINIDAQSIDEGINEALGAIGTFAGGDRSFVCLFEPEREIVTNTHEWCAAGVESSIERWRAVAFGAMPSITVRQRGGETVHVPRVSALPPADRQRLEAEGIRSFVTVPLVAHGEVLGFLGLDTLREERTWSDDTISLLSVVAEIVVNALERKRQDHALHESEARLKSIMDNSPSPIYLKDTDGRYLLVNRSFEARARTTSAQIEGKTAHDLLDQSVADRATADDRTVLETGRLIERERVLPSPDGQRAFVSVKFPVVDKTGDVVGIGGIDHDITERKRIEDRLRQAQKMEAVGQLTGGVAHDFNNLLTVLLGNLQMLQVGFAQDAELREIADTALDAATRGAQLTQRLLAFSRRRLSQPELVDVRGVIDGMRPLLHQTLGESIEVELRIGADSWPTLTDPTELESALLNLAINARDAMPSGGQLTLETGAMHSDGRRTRSGQRLDGEFVTVSVSDTGEGIPAKILDRVFEPFYSTKEVGKGSGLGLSMVYGFVQRSGGRLDIESDPSGTVVTLYLSRAHERRAVPRDGATVDAELPTGSETVLVVEDQPLLLRTVSRMLERLGYRVLQAENAAAALTLLDSHPNVDLLLTDIVMPGGMNGVDLSRELAALRPEIKVLYTTGYADHAGMSPADEHAGLDLLRKPYEKEELAARIRSILDR